MKPVTMLGSIPFLSNRSLRIVMSPSTLYFYLVEDRAKIGVPEIVTGGRVLIVRSKTTGFSGARWEAFSPVNISSKDWPFRMSRWLWNTLRPKGCIFLKQLVCMKTLRVRLQCLFKTLRSSWAEVPSKSPINLRCTFSLFLWTEIAKLLAMIIPPFSLYLKHAKTMQN